MKIALALMCVVPLLMGAEPAVAQGQAGATARVERERLDRARAAADARLAERQRECLTRFVATSCVDDAKRERRETVARLRHEQMALEEKERKERAAARIESIRRKTEEAAARTALPSDQAMREPKGPKPAREPRAAHGRADHTDSAASASEGRRAKPAKSLLPAPRAKEASRSAEEAERSRATFDAAQGAAEAHRVEVEARNAARAVKKKPAAPLPLPPGALAP